MMDRRVEARVKMAQDEDCYPDVSSEILKAREHGLLLSAEWVFVITG